MTTSKRTPRSNPDVPAEYRPPEGRPRQPAPQCLFPVAPRMQTAAQPYSQDEVVRTAFRAQARHMLIQVAKLEVAPSPCHAGARVRIVELPPAGAPEPLALTEPMRVLARLASGATLRVCLEHTRLANRGQVLATPVAELRTRSTAELADWLRIEALPGLNEAARP